MKIYVYPADNTGCGHFRMIFPATELKKRGHDITIMPPDARGQFHAEIKDDQVVRVDYPKDADLLVLQRVSHKYLAQAVAVMRAAGVAVIMDIDDDLSTIHPNNPAWMMLHPRTGGGSVTQDHSWHHVMTAARNATLTVVSTDALARKYRGTHGARVLHNRVPNHYVDIPHEDSATIGWCGSAWTHPDDGPEAATAVSRLVSEGASFTFVGPSEYVASSLCIPEDAVNATGPVAIDRWPHEVAKIGIGIAPLADTKFNSAKCLDYDTRVVTGRGLIRIGEVMTDDVVWRDGWKNVLATEHTAECDGVEIFTEQGRSIALTRNHRLMVDGVWKFAGDLEIGDTLDYAEETWPQHAYQQVPWPADSRQSSKRWSDLDDGFTDRSFHSAVNGPKIEINEMWGRLLGLFVGDGCATPTGMSIAFDHQDSDVIEQIMSDLRSVALRPTFHSDKRYDGTRHRGCGINVSSAHLARFLELVGVTRRKDDADIRRGVERTLCIPEVIWKSPRSVVAAFLSGLWEADGSGDRGVSLCTKSEQLARDVQRALLGFGIVSALRISTIAGKSQNPKYVGRQYWSVVIAKRAADIFMREIGFISKRKIDKMSAVRVHVSGSHGSGKTITYADAVSIVRPVRVRPVDIQVEGEVFAAVSFVSHNSWLKPMEYAALGIPCVMSPRAEYVKLHEETGIGVLASRPKQWYRELRKLVDDGDYRRELGARSRDAARKLTYADHANRWMDIWEEAARLR